MTQPVPENVQRYMNRSILTTGRSDTGQSLVVGEQKVICPCTQLTVTTTVISSAILNAELPPQGKHVIKPVLVKTARTQPGGMIFSLS